jgi:hypothetical protein
MTKSGYLIAGLIVGAIVLAIAYWAVDVRVTDSGELPTVDVDVKEGELPKAKVDTVDVDVGEKKVEVPVPKVKMEEEQVTVPTVDVEPADASPAADRPQEQQ